MKKTARSIYKGMRKAWRSWKARLGASALVLLYHRVSCEKVDARPGLIVSSEHFDEQMRYLRQRFSVLSLEELVDQAGRGTLCKRSVAITFDDGYADNFEHAYPILKKYGIPASFFVTTSAIGQAKNFWWDELTALFEGAHELPPEMSINLNGKNIEFPLRRKTDRITLCSAWMHEWKLWSDPQITDALETLYQWARRPRCFMESARVMTQEELQVLGRDPLAVIGSHGLHHVAMRSQTLEVQRKEIQESKKQLEDWMGCEVKGFAYPYGLPLEHFDLRTVKLVREAGYHWAVSTCAESVRNGLRDFWQVPRCPIYDWNADELGRKLNDYFSW